MPEYLQAQMEPLRARIIIVTYTFRLKGLKKYRWTARYPNIFKGQKLEEKFLDNLFSKWQVSQSSSNHLMTLL